MTRHFRVDPRLVHGTVMSAWVPSTGTTTLVVADRNVLADPRRRRVLEIAAMDIVDVVFTSEREVVTCLDALRHLNDLHGRRPTPVCLILFSTLESVETAIASGLEVPKLNIGHIPHSPAAKEVHPAVFLSPEDFLRIDRLRRQGVDVFIQPLPENPLLPENPTKKAASTTEDAIPFLSPRSKSQFPQLSSAEKCVREVLRVVNEKGLHLRAAHALAHAAGRFRSQVLVGHGSELVNAKSLLGLTTLAAGCGTRLDVTVVGPDAEAAIAVVRALFATGFDEGVDFDSDSRDLPLVET